MWGDRLQQQGFALIPSLIEESEIRAVLRNLDDASCQRTRAGVRHVLSHPAVKALANDARLLGIAQAILGENAFPFQATLFDKSPGSNWLIAWHQDTALPLREKRETPGWGPWSVKQGVIYSHGPASVLPTNAGATASS